MRVPRARGDEPVVGRHLSNSRMVFPAPAGMNRSTGRGIGCWHGVPRARGDEPIEQLQYEAERQCSPRPRG